MRETAVTPDHAAKFRTMAATMTARVTGGVGGRFVTMLYSGYSADLP